jgi:hypothetical protein
MTGSLLIGGGAAIGIAVATLCLLVAWLTY